MGVSKLMTQLFLCTLLVLGMLNIQGCQQSEECREMEEKCEDIKEDQGDDSIAYKGCMDTYNLAC